jgi:hypothetical protein
MNKSSILLLEVGIAVVAFVGGYAIHSLVSNPLAKESSALPFEKASVVTNHSEQKYAYESVPVCNTRGFCLKLVNYLGFLQDFSNYPDETSSTSTTFANDPLTRFLPRSDSTHSYCREKDSTGLFKTLNQMLIPDASLQRFYDVDYDLCETIAFQTTALVVTDSSGEIVGIKMLSAPGMAQALFMGVYDYSDLKLDTNNDIIWNKEGGATCGFGKYQYRIKYTKDTPSQSYGDPTLEKEEHFSAC